MAEKRAPTITVDLGASKVAREAARALADGNVVLSASAMTALRESGALKLDLVDLTGIRKAAEAMGPMPPTLRTQFQEIARIADTRTMSSALGLRTATQLAETIAALNLSSATQLRGLIDGLDFFPKLDPKMKEALRDLSRSGAFDLSPGVVQAVRSAITLARSEAVAESVDASLTERVRSLSASGRRELQTDLVGVVATLLFLAAFLFNSKRTELAAVVVILAAHLMRVYWRLAGKLD